MPHMPGFGSLICLVGFFAIIATVVVLIVILTQNRGGPRPQGFQPLRAPAHYIVHGVDKATRADKTWRVIADSEANARVKAELEGMVVTGVEFEKYV